MFYSKTRVRILRSGEQVYGSPFSGKLYYSNASHVKRYAHAPLAAKIRQSQIFSTDADANIRQGDLAVFPDGTHQKVSDVRRYQRGIQCDLMPMPYENLLYYTCQAISANTNSVTLNVTDKAYAAQGTIYGYIEPQQAQMLDFESGNIDISSARAFTLKPVSNGDILVNADGTIWAARGDSQFYSQLNDYIATMSKLASAPPGVTI